jgi:hypothetical protein
MDADGATPIHMQGSTAAQLAATAALCETMALRGCGACEELAREQLAWVFGRNPFSQCLMYGEGYRYPKLWAGLGSNVVGALPVGINCRRGDMPYWPAINQMTFKEQWVVPAAKLLLALGKLSLPARISGRARRGATFTLRGGGETITVAAGAYSVLLDPGAYDVRFGDATRSLSVVAGQVRQLDLDPHHFCDVQLFLAASGSQIEVRLSGIGHHRLEWRLHSLKMLDPPDHVELDGDSVLRCAIAPVDPATPWLIILIVNDDIDGRAELGAFAETSADAAPMQTPMS